MARTTIVKMFDDLDGTEAVETVKFGLDGSLYEIDLSAKNAAKLRSALSAFVDNGTKVPSRPSGAAPRSAAAGRRTTVGDREQNAAIRAWATRKGYDVAPRGRIKAEIVDQYHREAGR
jgi:hypothetical protein